MKTLFLSFLRFITQILFRVRLRQLAAIPTGERLVIVVNHQSFLDGLLLRLFLPVPDPVFVVYSGLKKNFFFRFALQFADSLAVDPTRPMAMKQVIRLVKEGRPLVIFPEGRITKTGSLMKIYEGPAFIAAKTGAAILPIYLDGGQRSYFSRLSKNRRLFPAISMTVLPVKTIAAATSGPLRERRRQAGESLRKIMEEMVFLGQRQTTLFAAFCQAADWSGREIILEDMKGTYRYRDLLKMTLGLGHLTAKFTEPGERVGLLLPNLAATICLILGLNSKGRTPALLNYTAGVEGMRTACLAAGLKTVITARAFLEQMRLTEKIELLAETCGLKLRYIEEIVASVSFADKIAIAAALLNPRRAETAMTPDDPAVVLFTSGSEGAPKGVVLSQRAILANINQVKAVMPLAEDDKFLSALPLFHSFGLTAGAFLPLLSSLPVMLYPSPLHYRVIPELIYDRDCTVLFGASTFLKNYARFAHPYDFRSLRYVVAGAEKLQPAVRDLWAEKFGLRVLEGYGATECAPVVAVNSPMACKHGTVGQVIPGLEAKISPVPGVEKGGLLHVRGPNVMSGYLKIDKPGLLQPPSSALGAGWYDTGDIVEIDADGFLSVVGRVKRFAKIGGEMVSLEAVEAMALAASPGKLHAAVNLPDPAKGETILLFTTDASLRRDALQKTMRERGMAEIALPKEIIYLETLPLLGTGKTDYQALKKLVTTNGGQS